MAVLQYPIEEIEVDLSRSRLQFAPALSKVMDRRGNPRRKVPIMAVRAVKGLPSHTGIRQDLVGRLGIDRDLGLGRPSGVLALTRKAEDSEKQRKSRELTELRLVHHRITPRSATGCFHIDEPSPSKICDFIEGLPLHAGLQIRLYPLLSRPGFRPELVTCMPLDPTFRTSARHFSEFGLSQ